MTAGAVLSAVALMGTSALLPNNILGHSALTASAETVVHNPIIWADVPDDDILRVGDTYYMVSTTMFFSPGAPIMKSDDLVSWELCNYVYDTMANGDVQNLTNGKHDYAHGQWAASLRYKDGWFYVFFGSYGTGKSYIYKTRDIENGSWDRVELNGMYHDASILFDDDGRNYLVYGGGGEIKIKEFNSEMTGFKQGGVDKARTSRRSAITTTSSSSHGPTARDVSNFATAANRSQAATKAKLSLIQVSALTEAVSLRAVSLILPTASGTVSSFRITVQSDVC